MASKVQANILFDLPNPMDQGKARELILKLEDTVAQLSAHHAQNIKVVVSNVVASF